MAEKKVFGDKVLDGIKAIPEFFKDEAGAAPTPDTLLVQLVDQLSPPIKAKEIITTPDWAKNQPQSAGRWGSEWPRVAVDLEIILGNQIAKTEPVTDGLEPIIGRHQQFIEQNAGDQVVSVLKTKDKIRCEDRKIVDESHGLYAVMDGVSTAKGKYKGAAAAEILSRVVQYNLGGKLDQSLRILVESGVVSEVDLDRLVRTAFCETIRLSEKAIGRAQRLDPIRYGAVTTTLSCAKVVELPSGIERLYYTNFGDSRIQIVNPDGSFKPVTVDDNLVGNDVKAGVIFRADGNPIDQAFLDELDQYSDLAGLSHKYKDLGLLQLNGSGGSRPIGIRQLVNKRNIITNALGMSYETATNPQLADIQFIDLLPGQYFVITSDGVHDSARRVEMEATVNQIIADPNLTDDEKPKLIAQALQDLAYKIQTTPDHLRAKPDDTAAVVGRATQKRGIVQPGVIQALPREISDEQSMAA